MGVLCKTIPGRLPHELLGYDLDSVEGTLLSIELANYMNIEENKAMSRSGKGKKGSSQGSRMSKFRANK